MLNTTLAELLSHLYQQDSLLVQAQQRIAALEYENAVLKEQVAEQPAEEPPEGQQ